VSIAKYLIAESVSKHSFFKTIHIFLSIIFYLILSVLYYKITNDGKSFWMLGAVTETDPKGEERRKIDAQYTGRFGKKIGGVGG
jgi:hypothetical protein